MSEKVAVFDTTLRDGEQAAGTRLGSREKLMIARQLALLKVDIIEAGYPASSPEDFEAVQLICPRSRGPRCLRSLARRRQRHSRRAAKLWPKHSGRASTPASALRTFTSWASSVTSVTEPRSSRRGHDSSDGSGCRQTGSPVCRRRGILRRGCRPLRPGLLIEMLQAVIDAGATVVNIPDTTGYAVPEQYGCLIRTIRQKVPNIGQRDH